MFFPGGKIYMNKCIKSLLFIMITVLLLPACGGNSTSERKITDNSETASDKDDSNSLLSFLKDKVEIKKETTAFERLFQDGPKLAWDDSNKAGYIDINGDWVIEPHFRLARPFSEEYAAAFDSEKEKWGYINTTGEWVIQPMYYSAGDFEDGMAYISLDGKNTYGVIDKSGNYLIEPYYYKVSLFKEGYALVQEGKNTTCHFIDEKGNKVFDEYYNAFLFNNGVTVVQVGQSFGSGCDWSILKTDGVSWIIDVTPEDLDSDNPADYFPWRLCEDSFPSSYNYGGYDDHLFGYINLSRGCAVKLLFDDYIMIDDSGNAISPKFDYLHSYGLGEYAQAGKYDINGKKRLGFVRTDTFEWVVDPIYWEESNYYKNYAWAVIEEETGEPYKVNYHWYIIDMEGNTILDFDSPGDIKLTIGSGNIYPDKPDIPLIATKKFSDNPMDFKCGYVDWNYNEVIPFIYDSAESFVSDGSYAIAKYDGHYGMIDKEGNWLIEPKFSSFEIRYH